MDYKFDNNYISKELFNSLKNYLYNNTDIITKYNCKLTTNSMVSTYPQIVFTQDRINNISSTIKNELRQKNIEMEINIYAIDKTINNQIIDAQDILEDISNHIVYFLEKICRIRNVDITTNLTNFDGKDTQSEKTTIRFDITWLQDYNIKI